MGTERRTVWLDAFGVDRFPVTNRQYHAFVTATGYRPDDPSLFLKHWPAGGAPVPSQLDLPVVYVSHGDAVAYANWLGLRLLSEAEWEKAVRGTDGRRYPWGAEPPAAELAWFGSRKGPAAVGRAARRAIAVRGAGRGRPGVGVDGRRGRSDLLARGPHHEPPPAGGAAGHHRRGAGRRLDVRRREGPAGHGTRGVPRGIPDGQRRIPLRLVIPAWTTRGERLSSAPPRCCPVQFDCVIRSEYDHSGRTAGPGPARVSTWPRSCSLVG
jgi:hypothetical protein